MLIYDGQLGDSLIVAAEALEGTGAARTRCVEFSRGFEFTR